MSLGTLSSLYYWNHTVLAAESDQHYRPESKIAWTRAYVSELQNAAVGRKYAHVDRRPLDPPPVVSLHIYDCNESEEVYRTPEEIDTLGYICHVDLFPCDDPKFGPEYYNVGRRSDTDITSPQSSSTSEIHKTMSYPSNSMTPVNTAWSSFNSIRPMTSSMQTTYPLEQLSSRVIHYSNGRPIREDSNLTKSLVGSTFVQPNIIYWEGKAQLMFVFSDISVRCVGSFLLRYRIFDLLSSSTPTNDIIEAKCECFGKPFRVYSTKEFPGLQPSTELSKVISDYGIRINTRKNARQGHPRESKGNDDDSPFTSSPLKRKRSESLKKLV